MNLRRACLALFAAIFLASIPACTKPQPAAPPAKPALSPDTVVRVHWMGKRLLGINAGAYYLMRIWNLPDSSVLENFVTTRLSTAPWRLLLNRPQATNATTALLQDMLGDALREECFLEIRQPANLQAQFVFAIHLDPPRADAWYTNLALVVESLTGGHSAPAQTPNTGWTLNQPGAPNLIKLTQIGSWALLSAGPQSNPLFDETAGRIARDATPFAQDGTNYWIEADLDMQRLSADLPDLASSSTDLPKIALKINGDGGNVLERVDLKFPRPLNLQFDPWTFPTNRIVEPIVSFSALRGFGPALSSWKQWSEHHLSAPPDQFYAWAPDGAPQQIIFTAPAADADGLLHSLTALLTNEANSWMPTHGTGKFEIMPDGKSVAWTGLPIVTPFLRTVDGGQTLLGALRTDIPKGTNSDSPLFYHPSLAELLADAASRSNLVWYDWELTSPRVNACLTLGQVLRIGLGHPQLPVQSIPLGWLNGVRLRLGNSTTLLTLAAPDQLILNRKSTLGLTGAELQLMADWLESPEFPKGLYSLQSR